MSTQNWKWFSESSAYAEVQDIKSKAVGTLPQVAEPVREVYQGLPDVSGSVLIFGGTGYIGEAVVFEAVRRGLEVAVFIREKSVARFTSILEELKIKDRVQLCLGDVANQLDVETAMKDTAALSIISLLASPQILDEEDIYNIDYKASHNIVQAARKSGVQQFIYCSDTGTYDPSLPCQLHKLRIEGELMRCMPDEMQWTIVRPTSYIPYVASIMILDSVRQGKAVPLFGEGAAAGNLAVTNPIAREDLARFFVSCVLNKDTYGRVMAVGGPWSEDNVVTMADVTNCMIEAVGSKASVKPLSMDTASCMYGVTSFLGKFSSKIKRLSTIVFFYTRYWNSVTHFSPGTGTQSCLSYTKELVNQMKKNPEKFTNFIKNFRSGADVSSLIYPMERSAWWDISQESFPENKCQWEHARTGPTLLACCDLQRKSLKC